MAKRLEAYRLFFLEDVLPPSKSPGSVRFGQQSATPQAMGELFTSPHEWMPLIQERLIDSYPRARVQGGRHQRLPQDRGLRGGLRGPHGVAGGR